MFESITDVATEGITENRSLEQWALNRAVRAYEEGDSESFDYATDIVKRARMNVFVESIKVSDHPLARLIKESLEKVA
jgi:hypothetical protein